MQITLTRPDDWHVHFRDGACLARTVPDTAAVMQRAIVMPNLKPPVTTTTQAEAYRRRVLAHVPAGREFEPLMTLYLTDMTTVDEVERAAASGIVRAFKLYPAGATTNSDSGVTDIGRLGPVLEAMAVHDVKLLVHGEVTDPEVDIFDREAAFLQAYLAEIVASHPRLKVVLEHITTAEAVAFVEAGPPTLGATITAHHLLFERNAMLAGGIRPHYYCLPVLKRRRHQRALIAAATGGDPKFFLGTDSAPHTAAAKESACGCAGSYTSYAALSMYAAAFEKANALDALEAFASHHGPDFYGLPRNTDTITLEKSRWTAPERLDFGGEPLVPLLAGQELDWRVVS